MTAGFVRVPYYLERDGTKTFFLPACRMATGYRIGAKGDEITVADYWDALARLAAMQPPRFRRPNAEGNFGIVTCDLNAWEEVNSDYIEAEASKHRG